MTPKCCNLDSVWVENVPGKGYYFCKECRNEVEEKVLITEFWDKTFRESMIYGTVMIKSDSSNAI